MRVKQSTRTTLENLKYPLRYKRFSKIFKRIKKSDRRFFIKLLKTICKDIENKEMIHFATFSQVNLNQHGLLLLMNDRVILVHSKVKSKRIFYEVIPYQDIINIDFDLGEEAYGHLYMKAKREHLTDKNYKIRLIRNEDLPQIVQFIRNHL